MSNATKKTLRWLIPFLILLIASAVTSVVINQRVSNEHNARVKANAEQKIAAERAISNERVQRAEAIANASQASSVRTCEQTNQVRVDFLSSLEAALQRSRLALDAALASPSFTEQQKATAQRNYDGAKIFYDGLNARAHPQTCTAAALGTTTTTTVASGG